MIKTSTKSPVRLSCPATAFYTKLHKKFHTGWEKAENKSLHHCKIDNYIGKISPKLMNKFRCDKKAQNDISRGLVKDLSILFADIRGFTSRTADMSPEKIVTLLDLFIPEMLHIIVVRHQGMIDKLLGDGLMALYGHPYTSGQDIVHAILSAVDMQQAANAMGDVLHLMEYDPIEIGVGINDGSVLICEVGDVNYRETTVIGAPVNLAAKMEDLAERGQIVMPEVAAQKATSVKKEMGQFFIPADGSKHNITAVSFDWVSWLKSDYARA